MFDVWCLYNANLSRSDRVCSLCREEGQHEGASLEVAAGLGSDVLWPWTPPEAGAAALQGPEGTDTQESFPALCFLLTVSALPGCWAVPWHRWQQQGHSYRSHESILPLSRGSYWYPTAPHEYSAWPKGRCHFPPDASHWISLIAHCFMWPSNNSLCSLHIPQSPPLWGDTVQQRQLPGECMDVFPLPEQQGKASWPDFRVQLVKQQCCEGMFSLLGISFPPWRLLPAAREISSLRLRNNKIPLTLITAWALWKPFWAGSVVLNRTNRMRDALISVQAVKLNKSGFNEKVAVVQWCSFQLPTYFKKTNPPR